MHLLLTVALGAAVSDPSFLASLGPVKVAAPVAPATLTVDVRRSSTEWISREKTEARTVKGQGALTLRAGGAAHASFSAAEASRYDVSRFASRSGKDERSDSASSASDAFDGTWSASADAVRFQPASGAWSLRCVALSGGALPGAVWACQPEGTLPDSLEKLTVPAGPKGEPWLFLGAEVAGLQVESEHDSRREPELQLRFQPKK